MLMVYREEYLLRACNCDLGRTWRPSAMLEAMQETAGEHCARLGLPRAVLDARGVIWVLSRLRVEMERLPVIGETIAVETWPLAAKHMFFPRATAFCDGEGRRIGAALSLWVLMDLRTRRITRDDFVLEHLPENADLSAPTALPASVRPLPVPAEEGRLRAQFIDLDLNGHVNNARYLDWCCNALGVETLRESEIRAFDVNYDAEVLPDATLETALTRQADRFAFTGSVQGKRHFAVAGTLAARRG